MRPKKVILLVDANEVTQSTMRFLLETRGYRVASASTAQEAIDLARAEKPNVFLLCDTGVPDAWVKLSPALKEIYYDVQVVFLSKSKDRHLMHPYCDNFISGTASRAELVERLRVYSACKRGPVPMRKPVASVEADAIMRNLRGLA